MALLVLYFNRLLTKVVMSLVLTSMQILKLLLLFDTLIHDQVIVTVSSLVQYHGSSAYGLFSIQSSIRVNSRTRVAHSGA
jgi:hypothetical protein